ncbi:MAG: M23 family metallopeptidase [Clostridia bacterium]|nr:M23 family metallopeptidase [Clostridia bacterium]
MLKMSSRMRFATKLLSKLCLTVAFSCVIVMSLMFMKYKFVYSVKINEEDVGYVTSKIALEKKIDNFIINGEGENVGYVVLNSKVDYNLLLINKDIQTSDDEIFAMVKDDCDVYYKVYAVLVDDKEHGLVASLEDAQKIVDEVNEKQSEYKKQSTLEIEEQYLLEYELLDDIEVAINDIYEPIKKTNDAIKEIRSTPATAKTVSNDVLLALKESLTTLDFNVPLDNPVITSRFGWRSSGYHYGIDLAAPMGTDITAAEAGVITYADWCGNYGYLIKVQHTGGYETYYAHCSKIIAKVGDEVAKDQLIGLVGSTGRSSGPHVHMEIRFEGTPLNPEVFLYD